MKRAIMGAVFLAVAVICQAGSVWVAEQGSADLKIWVCKYKSEADLCVWVADYRSSAKDRDEVWYFEKYRSSADFTVKVVKYKSEADLKVFYVRYKSEAGWRTSHPGTGRLR